MFLFGRRHTLMDSHLLSGAESPLKKEEAKAEEEEEAKAYSTGASITQIP